MKFLYICDACFFEKVGLDKHIKSVHEGEKPFKCNNCDKKFSEKGNTLNQFMKGRSHSNVTFAMKLFPKITL